MRTSSDVAEMIGARRINAVRLTFTNRRAETFSVSLHGHDALNV
jgi:hypothetical protein